VRAVDGLREKLQAGDKATWHTVLHEHSAELLGYATRLLGDRDSARDVVQEALVGVFRTIERYEGRTNFRSWLFRAVHNRAVDELRRRKRYVYEAGEDPERGYFAGNGGWQSPPGQWEERLGARLDAKELVDIVSREIETLPHEHREVLLLKEVYGFGSEEICEALGISPGNMRLRIHRARKALRAAVDRRMTGE
jgi:RNA polymerase sigma-70 factor (ECF subfamily)